MLLTQKSNLNQVHDIIGHVKNKIQRNEEIFTKANAAVAMNDDLSNKDRETSVGNSQLLINEDGEVSDSGISGLIQKENKHSGAMGRLFK